MIKVLISKLIGFSESKPKIPNTPNTTILTIANEILFIKVVKENYTGYILFKFFTMNIVQICIDRRRKY